MALSVDGRDREDITRASFVALGDAVGLPERAVARLLDRLVDRVDRWIDHLDELPFDRRRVHKLRRVILGRAGKLG